MASQQKIMKMNSAFNMLIFMLGFGFCHGQTSDFKYKLELQNVNESWHKIILSDDFFDYARQDFSDVRIYGVTKTGDTLETPYIKDISEFAPVHQELTFKLINQSSIQSKHYFTFETQADQTINEIQLDFEQDNFDWKLQLEGSFDQKEWFLLTTDYRIVAIKNEITDYQFSKVIFPDSKYKYYRGMIKSNIKPKINQATILGKNSHTFLLKNVQVKKMDITSDKKLKRTEVVIELPYQASVSELTIRVKDTFDFFRPLKILCQTDSVQIQNGWKYNFSTLASSTLHSPDKNPVTFDPTVTKKIKLIIENFDNTPLNIDTVILKGPVYSLIARFDKTDLPYHLYFGNNTIASPTYDLEYLKIPSTFSTIKTGKIQNLWQENDNTSGALFQNPLWLWLIMAVMIVTLGWFSFVMIKKNNQS